MDLLDRYLQAVGQHLPAKGREDTLAELRANLLAQIESREEELHRPLDAAEVAAIVERHGPPMLVAARYRPQQSLIGPALFPVYWFTLRRSFPFVLLAYLASYIGLFLGQGESGFDAGAFFGHLPGALLTFWGVVTLGFAVFEWMQGSAFVKVKSSPRWNPLDLPPVHAQPKRPSTAGALADLIVQVLFLGWLLIIPYRPYLLFGPGLDYVRGLSINLVPDWRLFYWQIVGLMALAVPLKALALVPGLQSWRRGLQLGAQVLGMLVLVVLVQAQSYFVPAAAMATESRASLTQTNMLVNAGFKIALAINVAQLLWQGWKAIREPRTPRAGCAMV